MTDRSEFLLGGLSVRPISSEVVSCAGVETLEPRVMQVLVALAQRKGEVVDRDTLIAQCWSGRAVGEDAIQRCIARLRRLNGARDAFAIDTIRGTGYRLSEIADANANAPALAVLVFDNLSADPELDHFCIGLSEEILDAVAHAKQLKVIGRTSSFRFREGAKNIAAVARLLKVSHVLDGSVRRSDNRIRVVVRLIEAATDQIVWTDRFDRTLANVFQVQDEIARAVSRALGAALPMAAQIPSVEPFAFELYRRGRELGTAFGKRGALPRAIALLDEAVIREPRMAQAWSLLAQVQVQYRANDAPADEIEPLRRKIADAVERALALDPDDGTALACLAFVEPPVGAFERQETTLKRALVAASASGVLAPYRSFCASVGRNREALRAAEAALQLDPLHQGIASWHAIMLRQNGFDVESNEMIERIVDAGEFEGSLLAHSAVFAAFDGDWKFVDRHLPARNSLDETMICDRGTQLALSAIAVLRDPDEGGGREVYAKALAEVTRSGMVHLGTLCLLARLSLVDEAFALAEKSSFDRLAGSASRLQFSDIGLHFLFSPSSKALRRDRRFVGLCAKLGLADYWTRTGQWPDCAQEDATDYDFVAECGGAATN